MTSEAELAVAVRAALAKTVGSVREVKMFGGVGFMLDGSMVAATSKRGLMLRVGQERYDAALAQPGARMIEMRGREMRGYVSVDPATLTEDALHAWLEEAVAFVRTLPPKSENAKRERSKPERKGARK